MEPQWLLWSRALQAIAQTGLAFSRDKFDIERYQAIRRLASEIMASHSGADEERIELLFAAQMGYATPKVDVRGAMFRDNKILLVRETLDSGRWTLPGGWADVNQSASECVVREIQEESGFEAVVRKLAAVYDRAKHRHEPPLPFHCYKMFFICEIVGGVASTSIETDGVEFFGESELPELSTGRVLDYQIRRMFEHLRNPELPTEFD
jgi:ADP-ribose pyrophosphatase YjhB (NUDIX family)